MDSQVFIDAARYAHIFTVAIGFGAAFLADYHVISRLGRPIDNNLTTTMYLCHSVIWMMVFGMWVTGLILVQIRTGFVLENFTPKLISKLVIVAILTANAFLISKIAMPLVEENRGRSLMWLPLSSKLCLAGIGAVSSASWMLALAMGSSKVLATSDWIVFAILVPFIYFAGVLMAVAIMFLLHLGSQMVTQRPKMRDAVRIPAEGSILTIGTVEQPKQGTMPDKFRVAARLSEARRVASAAAPERSIAPNIPVRHQQAVSGATMPRVPLRVAAE